MNKRKELSDTARVAKAIGDTARGLRQAICGLGVIEGDQRVSELDRLLSEVALMAWRLAWDAQQGYIPQGVITPEERAKSNRIMARGVGEIRTALRRLKI